MVAPEAIALWDWLEKINKKQKKLLKQKNTFIFVISLFYYYYYFEEAINLVAQNKYAKNWYTNFKIDLDWPLVYD